MSIPKSTLKYLVNKETTNILGSTQPDSEVPGQLIKQLA